MHHIKIEDGQSLPNGDTFEHSGKILKVVASGGEGCSWCYFRRKNCGEDDLTPNCDGQYFVKIDTIDKTDGAKITIRLHGKKYKHSIDSTTYRIDDVINSLIKPVLVKAGYDEDIVDSISVTIPGLSDKLDTP